MTEIPLRSSCWAAALLGVLLLAGCDKLTGAEPEPESEEPESESKSEPESKPEPESKNVHRSDPASAGISGPESKSEPESESESKAESDSKPEPDPEPEDPPVVGTKVPVAPFEYTLIEKAPVTQASKPPKLVKLTEAKNAITDDEAWFTENRLDHPDAPSPKAIAELEQVLGEDTPRELIGMKVRTYIDDLEQPIAIYGKNYVADVVVIFDADYEPRNVFDFSAWRSTPEDVPTDAMFVQQEIRWAAIEDGVLFVSSGHRTYANSSGGLNAYVSALSLDTGTLLWRSEPLVSNAQNFLVRDGYILTGYGFTAEKDFMVVLDARTGETVQKLKVKSGPTYILARDDEVFVRTYNRNYTFAFGDGQSREISKPTVPK
jgi:hypothetical protein